MIRICYFLKNLMFSPSVNFMFMAFSVSLALLFLTGDLTPYDVLLVMYVASAGVPGVRRALTEDGCLKHWFQMFPVTRSSLFRSVAGAVVLYSITVTFFLTVALALSTMLTKIGAPHITFMDGPGGETISVLEGYMTDETGRVEIPYREALRSSILFGKITGIGGWPVFRGWLLLVPLLFFSTILYYSTIHIPLRKPGIHSNRFLHAVALILFLIPACCAGADWVLPGAMVFDIRTVLDNHPCLLTLLFSLSVLLYSFLNARQLAFNCTDGKEEQDDIISKCILPFYGVTSSSPEKNVHP